MRPRSRDRRNCWWPVFWEHSNSSFNEAVVSSTTETSTLKVGRYIPEELQWGRGLATTETEQAAKGIKGVKKLQWGGGLETTGNSIPHDPVVPCVSCRRCER